MNGIRNTDQCVLVGISGGVDSAVAAWLLQEAGYDVHAAFLQTWHASYAIPDNSPLEGARAVAQALGLPFYALDVRTRFYEEIVQGFLDAYAQGLTPNPCVTCNPKLKFEALLEQAKRIEARWIATGHYAQIIHSADGTSHLRRARNLDKDQAYVLYRLGQRQLSRLLLPLGEIEDKDAVRDLARRAEIPSAGQRDSQDLCFVSGGDYRTLLRAMRPESLRPGPIYNEEGTLIGEHQGLPRYTVGQRKGLGIAAEQPLYVLELRPSENALIVGPAERLLQHTCMLDRVTFTLDTPPATRFTALGRIRYRATLTPITVEVLANQRAQVRFDIPQRGISPGQSLVFYQESEVLGGGIISLHEKN